MKFNQMDKRSLSFMLKKFIHNANYIFVFNFIQVEPFIHIVYFIHVVIVIDKVDFYPCLNLILVVTSI